MENGAEIASHPLTTDTGRIKNRSLPNEPAKLNRRRVIDECSPTGKPGAGNYAASRRFFQDWSDQAPGGVSDQVQLLEMTQTNI